MGANTAAVSSRVRDFICEASLAAATLTLWPILGDSSSGTAAQRGRAFAYIPIVGLAIGVLLAEIDRLLAPTLRLVPRSSAVVLVSTILSLGLNWRGFADTIEALRQGARPASTGLARISPIGAFAALAAFALEIYCLSAITDREGRASALIMATMLSRWSTAPVGYGLKPLERWGLGVPYEGGINFTEFAISSVIALGLTMTLYQVVGLLVIVVLAILILAIRLLYSRRLGGAAGYALAGAIAVVELIILAALAAVYR
ncbi:MAG TPA: adenosylcobinamide-GDP ribazoletransferase [Candidatus Binataceae bacterium]